MVFVQKFMMRKKSDTGTYSNTDSIICTVFSTAISSFSPCVRFSDFCPAVLCLACARVCSNLHTGVE
jgi:hypothetical protein